MSIILGVIYMFRSFQKMMLGEVKEEALKYKKQTRQETALLLILCILIVGFGVYPKPILAISEKSVIELLQGIAQLPLTPKGEPR